MTASEIRTLLLQCISQVAPEAELSSLRAQADIRDALDIDSMDFTNYVIAVHQKLGVDVPARDYPELYTLERAVEYLNRRLETQTTGQTRVQE